MLTYLGGGVGTQILLSCDLDKYDERWELSPKKAVLMVSDHRLLAKRLSPLCNSKACRGSKPSCNKKSRLPKAILLDLRQSGDFAAAHVRGSHSSPLTNLSSKTGDIFADSDALHMHWTNLRRKFAVEDGEDDDDDVVGRLGSKVKKASSSPLLVICYDGETSRLATSILRAKGHEAFSVLGGFGALLGYVREGMNE